MRGVFWTLGGLLILIGGVAAYHATGPLDAAVVAFVMSMAGIVVALSAPERCSVRGGKRW